MTIKRSMVGGQAPAYENRLDRDPKSKTFGKKLHYPLHIDGSPSHEGYVKASEALFAHRLMVTKAVELARAEGYNAHDEALDIQSNPYTGALGRAWEDGWKQADSDGVVELDGQQETDTSDDDYALGVQDSLDAMSEAAQA